MARLGLVIPDELENQLKVESDEQERPVAVIVRKAIEEYFASRGKIVKINVQWGGPKDRGKLPAEVSA